MEVRGGLHGTQQFSHARKVGDASSGVHEKRQCCLHFSSLWKRKASLENKVCHYLFITSECAQVLVHGCGGQRSPFRSQVSPPPHGLLLRL